MVRLRYTARLAQSTWSLVKISQHRILIISSEKGFDTFWGKGEFTVIGADTPLADRRHPLPSAALLRTVRATFTAYGSSLHKGVLSYPPAIKADFAIHTQSFNTCNQQLSNYRITIERSKKMH
ncbi:hypothetical protein C9I92_16075 [Photobacterium ganghwense]|uniref:Uncharacterized protein n=1 Tax=Photobacterium ganghwense TaxID=320778 RepID=A0A0J1H8X1_9GAMM|nr:hypothetical protein ABT57_15055 [Photobacterium ganghwense]PSU07254.1 hypothetical protein C9I92_16075 [Photobacterium ganghwense]